MKKSVIELFAGVGGFRVGLNNIKTFDLETGLADEEKKWNFIWANQYEPSTKKQDAYDCYKTRFGDKEISNEDISKINKSEIPDHNLLTGGFPCLTGDTLVLTKDGYKMLIDVTTNDYVLSQDRKWHKVLKFMKQGIKPVYEIQSYGFDSIKATDNHKFYVRRKGKDGTMSKPKWVELKYLIKNNRYKNYYLGTPLVENTKILLSWDELNIDINVKNAIKNLNMNDEKLWKIVGTYLGIEDFEKIDKEFLDEIYDFSNEDINCFLKYFGTDNENKKIPGFIYDLPYRFLKSFVDGYINANFYYYNKSYNHHNVFYYKQKKQDFYKLTSTNKNLIYGIMHCFETIYRLPCVIYKQQVFGHTYQEPKCRYKKKEIRYQEDYYCLCFYDISRKNEENCEFLFYEDNYFWYPLKKIHDLNCKMNVYDIEVEGIHSFVANNCLVHNCQDYSVARTSSNEKGIEGKKGVLFWEIIDILKEKKTSFVLLENVDRLIKSPSRQRGRDFGIMLRAFHDLGYNVEWRIINAADYGYAQRRRRIYIFAYKNSTKYYNKTMNIKLESNDIFIKESFFSKVFKINAIEKTNFYILNRTNPIYPDIVSVSNQFSGEFYNAGYMSDGMIYTYKVIEEKKKPTTLSEILDTETELSKYILTETQKEKFKYLKGAKAILRHKPDGTPYYYREGAVAPYDYLELPSRTMLTSEKSVNRSTHILPMNKDGSILRFLTPIEAERLQYFPDNWTNTGMIESKRYFMMGNALVTVLISDMEKELSKIFEYEK